MLIMRVYKKIESKGVKIVSSQLWVAGVVKERLSHQLCSVCADLKSPGGSWDPRNHDPWRTKACPFFLYPQSLSADFRRVTLQMTAAVFHPRYRSDIIVRTVTRVHHLRAYRELGVRDAQTGGATRHRVNVTPNDVPAFNNPRIAVSVYQNRWRQLRVH